MIDLESVPRNSIIFAPVEKKDHALYCLTLETQFASRYSQGNVTESLNKFRNNEYSKREVVLTLRLIERSLPINTNQFFNVARWLLSEYVPVLSFDSIRPYEGKLNLSDSHIAHAFIIYYRSGIDVVTA